MNIFKNPTSVFIKLVSLFAIVLVPALTAFGIPGPGGGPHIVVEGLHSPRGLSFGPGDILYVAQAGDARTNGSIIAIRNSMSRNATFRTIISGLNTIGGGSEFLGISGISVLGRGTN